MPFTAVSDVRDDLTVQDHDPRVGRERCERRFRTFHDHHHRVSRRQSGGRKLHSSPPPLPGPRQSTTPARGRTRAGSTRRSVRGVPEARGGSRPGRSASPGSLVEPPRRHTEWRPEPPGPMPLGTAAAPWGQSLRSRCPRGRRRVEASARSAAGTRDEPPPPRGAPSISRAASATAAGEPASRPRPRRPARLRLAAVAGQQPPHVVWIRRPFGPVPAQALASERLRADHRADLVAVHVDVAGPNSVHDMLHAVVDSGVESEREPVAGRVDGIDDGVDPVRVAGGDVQHRSEDLFLEGFDSVDPQHRGRHESSFVGRREPLQQSAVPFGAHGSTIRCDPAPRRR